MKSLEGDGYRAAYDRERGCVFLEGSLRLNGLVINARNRKTCILTIRGSNAVPWQGKSLNNLKRLMPSLDLVLE